MTANEIAQMVRTEPYHTNLNRNVIADFIDQQADRIAELEKFIQDGIKTFGEIQDQQLKDKFEKPQTRTLSDAEIQKISHRYHYTYNPDYIRFARAILRKAQEK